MKAKLFYRIANMQTQQGLWYDFNGNFTGLIHSKFTFCRNKDLQMPFNPTIIGWLSATETLKELFNWFTPEDIINLQEYGYSITVYEAVKFRYHSNHWLIEQKSSRIKENLSLWFLAENKLQVKIDSGS